MNDYRDMFKRSSGSWTQWLPSTGNDQVEQPEPVPDPNNPVPQPPDMPPTDQPQIGVPLAQPVLIDDTSLLDEINNDKAGSLNFKRVALSGAVVLVLFALGVGGGALSGNKSNTGKKVLGESTGVTQKTNADGTLQPGKVTPDFNSVSQSGGELKKLSANGNYYQYSDTLDGSKLTISKQPLPDKYKSDQYALQEFATSMGAKTQIQTNRWGTAYLQTSGSVQVVVCANDSKQLIIQSLGTHTTDVWKKYIDSLSI